MGSVPPHRPPGHDGYEVSPVRCPYCGSLTNTKSGNLYWCPNDGEWFSEEESHDEA
jgi:hypothetical protein